MTDEQKAAITNALNVVWGTATVLKSEQVPSVTLVNLGQQLQDAVVVVKETCGL